MKMIHRGRAIQQGCKNSHKYDEKPKNFPSRFVTEHCSDNAKIRCLDAANSLGVLKTEDIHPPKTVISVHFSGSLP